MVAVLMATIADLAGRRAIVVLAELGKRGKMSMAEFVEASTVTFVHARKLRLDLEKFGLVATEEIASRGAMREYEIRLTPLGREVAKHLVAVDEALRKGDGT